ncbi:MAG: hypothetical protein SOY64_06530 [Pyramidobacter sp.]|uniref:YfcC family protein n=1 Tax=Pyramidobacter sp. TaxID=1943581 RepID=UPI002A804266|nr:AbgT family transporter [Pyramidobacter sp.]MDY4032699.1 hypothetical protein [Pyramidobacter sp.]
MSGLGKQKEKMGFPDVYALLFLLCIIAVIATWFLPAGQFDRVTEGNLKKVIAGSYHLVEKSPQSLWDMMLAIYQGFLNSARVIFMIFFCGASVSMLEESKALSTCFTALAHKLRGKEALTIGVIMFSLGLANSAGVFGNIGIALLPIGAILARAMGGDDFLGFLIIYFGMMSGFSIGFANPGILGVAQTIAEIPIFSGTTPRAICCVINVAYLYIVTMYYFRRIKKDPTYSLNYEEGLCPESYMGLKNAENNESGVVSMTKRQMFTVIFFLIGVAVCVGFTIKFRWSNNQISAWFLSLGILTGIFSGFNMNEISKKLIKNCAPMVGASFVTGVATAISVILGKGQVLDTIVNALATPLNTMGAVAGAGFMVIVNAIINILIPSGSGQAAVVMPLMTPVADLVGITRQVAVQAFQFGDGLSNLLTPLNGPMMGCLALAAVGFPKYIRWAFKFIVIQIIAATAVTMFLQSINYIGF